MAAQANSNTIIVTAGDTNVMPLLQGLIRSLEGFAQRQDVTIACFDLGQTEADRQWLREHDVAIVQPGSHMGLTVERMTPYEKAVIVRPFLRDYFPGHDVYIWMDSDIWLQGWWVVDAFRQGALQTGLAIAHERERAYRFQWRLSAWFAKHLVLGYGAVDGLWLYSRAHLNAGLFALGADSPHWALWFELYRAAYQRTGKLSPHDQFSLNRFVYGRALSRREKRVTVLPPRCNWVCIRGQPMWNDAEGALCEPYAPYRPLGAIHLAGPGKTTRFDIQRTGGGSFEALLLQGVRPPS